MKAVSILVTTLAALASATAFAEKPEWAGKGKPTAEQVESHREAMKAKNDEKGAAGKKGRVESDDEAGEQPDVEEESAPEGKKAKDKGKKEKEKAAASEQGEEAASTDDASAEEAKPAAEGADKRSKKSAWWNFWQ